MSYLSKSTSTDTSIATIGAAVLAQTAIRYTALTLMLWLALSYANGWILAALEGGAA